MSTRPLSELCDGLPLKVTAGDINSVEINAITADSRHVGYQSMFVAVKGAEQDGAAYVADAIAQGAVAIISREGAITDLPANIVHLTTNNDRKILAKLAARFYSPQPRYVVAVTGTDGKTSTAEFFRQLIEATNSKAASIGTLGLNSDTVQMKIPAINTSPDPVLLHAALQKLAQHDCDYVALEASSHGLHQYRLDGVQLTAGAFTNLGRDHMDYHKNLEDYFAAKKRLFGELLPQNSVAIVWKQERQYEKIAQICKQRRHRLVSFGGEGADLRIMRLERLPTGISARLNIYGNKLEVQLGLIGDFQLLNILAAVGLAAACGKELLTLQHVLHKLKPVRGRLEKVAQLDNGATIYIDYAHTADALKKALQALRGHCHGRLAVLFGCGGNRDTGKRPLMGKVAAELADRVIITDDNPRTENAATIRKQVYAGCANKGKVDIIAERKRAIAAALNELQAGDILLVAGKGHEDYQIIGTQKLPFDDAAVVRELLG